VAHCTMRDDLVLRDASGAILVNLSLDPSVVAAAAPWTRALALALAPGRHTLALRIDGEETASVEIDVAKDADSNRVVDLAFE
jgi:hypothetical protein